MRDYKDVFNEAYAEAIEDGLSEKQAAAKADEVQIDYQSSLIDAAMDALKYRDL